jgi:hypothetical protein
VYKKYGADQKQKNDENSPVVPTIIRDGSVGSGGNHCQKDTSCQQLQGWGHLARHARNVQLIRSRGMMETVDSYKDGTTYYHLITVVRRARNVQVIKSRRIIRNGSVGTAHNCCLIDIGCRQLQG